MIFERITGAKYSIFGYDLPGVYPLRTGKTLRGVEPVTSADKKGGVVRRIVKDTVDNNGDIFRVVSVQTRVGRGEQEVPGYTIPHKSLAYCSPTRIPYTLGMLERRYVGMAKKK